MKLGIKFCEAYCSTRKFRINGVEAQISDFGVQRDTDPDRAEPYGCGNMEFIPKPPKKEILEKYCISTEEYDLVAKKLKKALSFGGCDLCS